MTMAEIEKLEMVNKILQKNDLQTHGSTPIAAIYLELGVIPMRYIIQARRIMYLHYLRSLDEKQLLMSNIEVN